MENDIRTFRNGEVIFREKDYECCMYEVLRGSVKVYIDYGGADEKLLVTLGAGKFLGEIGLTESKPRTATAVAGGDDTQLAEINQANFSAYFRKNPMAVLKIMRNMSVRLRELTESYMRVKEAQADKSAAPEKKKGGFFSSLREQIGTIFYKTEAPFDEEAFISSQKDRSYMLRSFGENEVIFRKGDEANCMYDIHWGRVGIYENYGEKGETLIATLRDDEFFGEMGLIDELPRSATAVALEDNTRIQLISKEVFGSYLQERPAKVLMIMTNLSRRLRDLSDEFVKAGAGE